ncbi:MULTISPECIES: AAA domain-containing protein [unclassified Saccharopolyspora]|uniref:caspase, EACC1-associated type n=1 Tax=unclassified Saccharopolyspora TaxID=2646250 RepID=UPI001CD64046|nr:MULTISPECIES: AAA domain-containing protein [unclassified Saccharopolyspora]MCA1226592.1 caspase family protein [Saccharopolyspora sp. 6M]MCA1282015.1 caspase family protein [Saccharopolyspora sp. 7B]
MTGRTLRRHALLIHTENYQDGHFEALPSTRADVWQLKQVLEHRSIGGFASVRIASDRTADDMRVEIAEFLDEREQDELAFLYFSGHGVRALETTGEFHFIASDTLHDRLATTGVPAGFVNGELERCWAAHKVAMLDSCRSGGFALGFRTADPARGAAKSGQDAPLNSRGVYVLSSSGAAEESFSGEDTPDGPAPSVFTGAVVEALRTGKVAKDGSGTVSVDELFEHVSERLRGKRGQVPTKSSFGVTDRIVIASSPVGEPPVLKPARQAAAAESPTGTAHPVGRTAKGDPGWQELIDYYRSCVLDDKVETPYLAVSEHGRDYACLPGSERILSGDLDEDGTTEVPESAGPFLAAAGPNDELWAGYPAVMLHRARQRPVWDSPRFAPLLMRRVELVGGGDGERPRLRPYGPVTPHPGLAVDQLGETEAAELIATYQPTWHAGQQDRMATDARNLLATEFGLDCVQELKPAFLEESIDAKSPGDGARNAAVLIRVSRSDDGGNSLVKDLDHIAAHADRIRDTALAALLPERRAEPTTASGHPVTPLAANEAQLAVLRSASSHRLTVATGPPGTGKSQLVANAVATAVAHQQSVLVVSTNNEAVNEIWRRCDELLPDSVVRTGSSTGEQDYLQHEIDALQRLTKHQRPEWNLATALAEHRRSVDDRAGVQRELARKARLEARMLTAGRERSRHARSLGHTIAGLAARLGSRSARWEARARKVAAARLFGAWRRARLLRALDVQVDSEPAKACLDVAGFAAAQTMWSRHRDAVLGMPSDESLAASAEAAETALRAASRRVWQVAADTAVNAGKADLRATVQDLSTKSRTWSARLTALRHVRAWATTSLSIRRFPPRPGMFDLVIIDEASQCSIPQVLPLLFRAKRALIIGDVMQLEHITTIEARREALIRRRTGVTAGFLEQRRLAYQRHSAFHAAERANSGSLLLDEHYRCHPDIAAVSNELFYGGALTVLTDVRGRPDAGRAAVNWADAPGRSERPRSGDSWVNRAEVATVRNCVAYLLERLPAHATIGVATPFKAQKDLLADELRAEERVRVGTVHTFQGGERDVIVLSLVAAPEMRRGAVNWVNRQLNLWNVAITRARSHLIVVGGREFWRGRGIGGDLVRAAELTDAARTGRDGSPTDTAQRLYELISDAPDVRIELGGRVNGYAVDAIVRRDDGREHPVLIDSGGTADSDAGHHLHRMIRRCSLLDPVDAEPDAVRLPEWTLYDAGTALAGFGIAEAGTPPER